MLYFQLLQIFPLLLLETDNEMVVCIYFLPDSEMSVCLSAILHPCKARILLGVCERLCLELQVQGL